MYIVIDLVEYTQISGLSFAPKVSLTTDTMPVNEFAVDIYTEDTIQPGQYAELRDDLDNLWAKYWITYAEDIAPGVVHLVARSELALLEGVELDETVYSAEPLEDVLDGVMVRNAGTGIVAVIDYVLDNRLKSLTVTGYCPKQNARDRLQWVLFTCGAFLKTFFYDRPVILPLDDTETLIPFADTYRTPTVNHDDYVTSVSVTAYTFYQDADAVDDTSYPFPLPWAATEQDMSLSNPDVPAGMADNDIQVDGLYLINQANASALLSRLAARHFKRTSITVDVIDNGTYIPGDRVVVFTGPDTLYSGYIESAAYSFGKQVKATLQVAAAESREGAALDVVYTCDGAQIAAEHWVLPVDLAYSIRTRYIDKTVDGVRRVYRPQVSSVTGTMTSEGATATVPCEVALELTDGVLGIYSVDDFSVDAEGVVTIE